MEFIFDQSIPQAENEFEKCMTKQHMIKLAHIDRVIDEVGFENVPEHLIKHLWNNVYELRPLDGRVIFVITHKDTAYIIGAYKKQSNKMPTKIKRTLQQREKTLLENLAKE